MHVRLRPVLLAALLASAVVGAQLPAAAGTDPLLREQWGMANVGAPSAWATGTGSGITIAVVDTGVDFAHQDLASKLLSGRNFVDPGRPPQDDQGHGTHVAGIAAAATGNDVGVAGTAPGARILPVKVLDNEGAGSTTAISDGIRWAVDNGADVINLSFGPDMVLLATLLGSGLDDAVNAAWNRGAVVVIAAGNDALFSSSYSTINALIVTATTRDDRKAGYASSVGAAKWGIAAPGGAGSDNVAEEILSTYWKAGVPNAYAYLAGTSMAAPSVAGAAAVLRGLGLTPQQTVDRLMSTARDLGAPGRDAVFGAGRLDMAAAVNGFATAAVPVPAPPAPTTTRPAPVPRATVAPTTAPPTTVAAPPPAPVDASAPPAQPATVAAGSPAASDSGAEDRPWAPLGAAALALLGAASALIWFERRARWA